MSVFLQIPHSAWLAANDHAFAILDGFPVSPGHTLVVTRRVVPDWFSATDLERAAILALVDEVKARLDAERHPDGYNVGFNAGAAAGQTVPHLHVHVIPRYAGDVEDPRGGVRGVIPEKGNYLRDRAEPLTDGTRGNDLLRSLLPLLPRAVRVDVLAAFVQDSGLVLVEGPLQRALVGGASVRLLTGDYLDLTQAQALRRLLDWTSACAAARDDERDALRGTVTARIVESDRLGRAFHPKAWRVETEQVGVAFVGSSNLSKSALVDGVEWNLRVDRHRDGLAWRRIGASFEALWAAGTPLTAEWVDAYALRAREFRPPLPPGEVVQDAPARPPEPSEVQRDALAALARSRDEGRRRALVVLATGLGKTFLAAFDLQAFAERLGRRPRVLFVAHLREILIQAAGTIRQVWPEARFAWFLGGARPEGRHDVLFASIQSLARHVDAIDAAAFDYVVVDEVHHADARSYRRLLARLDPAFLLGLTATPDRADQGDVLGLFDDHVAHEVPLGVGVEQGLLVPFRYFGLKDATDYAPTWRNGRFDRDALATAVATQARMEALWDAWREPGKAGTRTLIFCASIAHAEFVGGWLGDRGVRVLVVHSGPTSADRLSALAMLEAGEIDAVAAVDLFNEGIDCRPIDRVVMLRPTESNVVFLQQLGRGLRTADGKDHLVVLDFVGNHRVFLDRVRTLLTLVPNGTSLRRFLQDGAAPELPDGCTVHIELEAIAMLERLLPSRDRNEVVRVYQELRASRGERPLAGELVRRGLSLRSLRASAGSWFEFVAEQGDLGAAAEAWTQGRAWLIELEKTPMTKCFKMVVLEVLLEADALLVGMELGELARRAHVWLVRNPELFRDLEGVSAIGDPRAPDSGAWRRYWDGNPVKAWTGGEGTAKAWFEVLAGDLRPRFAIPTPAGAAFCELTRELVDARLAEYRRRAKQMADGSAFEAKVISNQRDPILKLPDGRPEGDLDVRLPDGAAWRFRLRKIACNVAHRVGTDQNGLPDLLRGWFGPMAGRPGTDFRVRFFRTPDGWAVEPLGGQVVPLPARGQVVAYPTLRAAAGAAGASQAEVHAESVSLPGGADGLIAVRAAGNSMDGGKAPIRDGDWVLLKWARGVGLGAVEGRVALVAAGDADAGHTHHLKRVVRSGDGFVLRSDNPEVPPMEAAGAVPLALVVGVVRPESLGPSPGVVRDLRAAFDLSETPVGPWCRVDGHLFVQPERWTAPDRADLRVPDLRPGETAHVLARRGDEAVYAGVGRWREGEGWVVPALDFETWRAVSDGRSASRTLEARWQQAAAERAAELTGGELPRVVTGRGRSCRVVGASARGGVRIDGGAGGFEERTVSLTDLGWALAAVDDVRRTGGVLDESRVNRLRYLEGTPRGSTRWIDTGWALVLASRAVSGAG